MVVLVVEDEAIIACCCAAILEEAGFAVLGPAHTSGEALELSRGKRPDVALVDIDLESPGAGIGVAEQLFSQYGTAIVFTTGRLDQATSHRDVAVALLSKPYDPAELPGIVKYAASRPRAVSTRSGSRHFGQVTTPSREAGAAVPGKAVVPR
jgi:two-component system, response regulator PdtaR